MEKNKTGKYFKYAVGEIILVVIGILIALQINNWNTGKIQQRESIKLSERLYEENESNIVELKKIIKRQKRIISANLSILQLMGKDYTSKDPKVLDSLMNLNIITETFHSNSSVLTEAITTGKLGFFRNVELKSSLYDIPPLLKKVKTDENYVMGISNETGSFISENYSYRQMDYKFSKYKDQLGPSAFKDIDGRKILSNFKLENEYDNLFFIRNIKLKSYNDLLAKYKEISVLLEKDIKKR
jgi:hypothetical protein